MTISANKDSNKANVSHDSLISNNIMTKEDNKLQSGVIRFIGETEFARGEWIGVELDNNNGKNDGSVNGMKYFTCEDKHGLFVRRTAVAFNGQYHNKDTTDNNINDTSKFEIPLLTPPLAPVANASHYIDDGETYTNNGELPSSLDDGFVHDGEVDVRDTSNVITPHKVVKSRPTSDNNTYKIGQTVLIKSISSTDGTSSSSSILDIDNNYATKGHSIRENKHVVGVIKYIGTTSFAEGIWYGIAFKLPLGRNSGTVNGVQVSVMMVLLTFPLFVYGTYPFVILSSTSYEHI